MVLQSLPEEERAAEQAWPLSLSYYTVPELDALQVVAVAAENGCRHVGLRLLGGQPGGSEMPLMQEAALRRQLLAEMAARDVSALDANTARMIPQTRIEDFLPFLDVAAELGAKHVLTTLDDPEEARALENFTRLCVAAAERGLTIDIEFVPWLSIRDVKGAAAFLRRCNQPAAGIALDALHFYRSGSSLRDLAGLPAAWFRYLQLCDAPLREQAPDRDALIHEAVQERLLPGEGDIDLAGLLRVFSAGRPVALEIPQSEVAKTMPAAARVAKAVEATRALLQSI